MVVLEQSLVQEQIDKFRSKFGDGALKEVNEQFKPHRAAATISLIALRGISAVGTDRTNSILKDWMPKLGVAQFDFNSLGDRIKFGQANIFRAHGLMVEDQLAYEKTNTVPASACKYVKHVATGPDLSPQENRARTLVAVSGLAADRTGVAPAIIEAYAIKSKDYSGDSQSLQKARASAERLLNALPKVTSTAELVELVYSEDATSIGLGNFASGLHVLPSHYSGRVAEKATAPQDQLTRLATLLTDGEVDSGVWSLVETTTGVGPKTSIVALQNNASNGAAQSVSDAIAELSKTGATPDAVAGLINKVAAQAIKDSVSSVQQTSKLIGQAQDSWIYLNELQSGNTRGGIQALTAIAKIFGNEELATLAN